ARQGGKEAVERQHYERRSLGVDSKEQKHYGYQMRVERGFPCTRSSRRAERIAETVARSQGSGDPSHFPAKAEIVVGALKSVCMSNDDPPDAQRQRDRDDPERRCADPLPNSPQHTATLRARSYRRSRSHEWFYL